MLKSMTGYGQGSIRSNFGEIRIELKSVNHRFFDFRINVPRELSFLEPEFREEIRKRIKRGMIFLNLYWDKAGAGLGDLEINEELVDSLKKNLNIIQRKLKDSSSIPLELLVNFPGVIYFSNSPAKQKKARETVHKALNKALDNLLKSKKEEGFRIEKDFKNRLNLINKEVSNIAQSLPSYRKKIKEKISQKLRQIQREEGIDYNRLNKEVAFTLIRSDFTEETVRIKSHLKSLNKLVSKENSGKNIEFFLQELGREINTLGDKASDLNISKSAIRIKAELEKLRQQALNLE